MADRRRGMGDFQVSEPGQRRPPGGRRGMSATLRDLDSMGVGPVSGEPIQAPLTDLVDHPGNEPARLDRDKLERLVASVGQVGVLEPAVVCSVQAFLESHDVDAAGGITANSGTWVLLTGHRRRAAAAANRLATMPVVVRDDLAGVDGDEIALHENDAEARLGLTPIQEARRFEAAMRSRGLSQAKLAEHLGRPQGQISKRLALLSLPSPVQDLVDADQVTIQEAGKVAAALRAAEDPAALSEELEKGLASVGAGDKPAPLRILQAAEDRLAAQRATTATELLAKSEDLQVLRPQDVSEVHRLTDPDEIEAAKSRGDLAVTTGPEGPVYVRTSAPELSEAEREQRQREAAHRSRMSQLPTLLSRLTSDDQKSLVARVILTGLDAGDTVTRDARQLCREAGIGPNSNATLDAGTWRQQLPPADLHVATSFALAAIERRAAADDAFLTGWFLPWLTSHGYSPTEWEQGTYSVE